MDIISKNMLTDLIESCKGRAVSIYMPTYIAEPEARQNPIWLKNLTKKAENQLVKSGMDQDAAEEYIQQMTDLIDDETFWQDQDEGLALFLDETALRIFKIPEKFDEIAYVGPSFYITPLIPIFKGNGQFYLLSLDKHHPKIYKGSRFNLSRLEDIDLPESLQEIFDSFYEFHHHMQFHSKTSTPSPDSAQTTGQREGVFFGHGGEDIDQKAELRNYYHRFDDALMDFLADEEAPMVLAGVDYLHPIYKEANSYNNLLEEGITKDVEQMPVEAVHKQAWDIVKHKYQSDVEKALNVYRTLRNQDGDTTEDIEMIVSASYFKRINTLLIAEESHVWGNFNPENNEVIIEKAANPDNQDILNLAAMHTIINGGNVILLPKEDMPGNREAAAILRY